MAELPVARGLLLCELVIVEERTRNISLVNVFTTRVVEAVPTGPQAFTVFALLTNGQGRIPLELRINRLRDDAVVFNQSQPLTFPDPITEVRFVFRSAQFHFPETGLYEVTLASGAEPIAQTRLDIRVRRVPA